MRRVLAAISNHMDTGDITTLANPDIVAQIRELVQGRVTGPLQEGPEDIKLFGEEKYRRNTVGAGLAPPDSTCAKLTNAIKET